MNAMDDVRVGLSNIRDSYEKMVNKGMANNRPFHINQLGRRIRALKDQVAVMALEGYPILVEFHRQMGPILEYYGKIVNRGYKNARQECSDLEREIRLLETWADNQDDIKDVITQANPIEVVKVRVPDKPTVMPAWNSGRSVPKVQDDSRNGIYSVDVSEQGPPPRPQGPALTPEQIDEEYIRLTGKRKDGSTPPPKVPSAS